jgi:hypothetical protein
MTDFPEDLFSQLYKRTPGEADRERLTSVKAALGLSSRDEMWPVIMVLDHYNRTISAGRSATVKEVKELLQSLKAVSESAGPIAEAEAQKAIQRLIGDASNKIAKASAEKSITTADRISKQQIIVATITGGLITIAVAVTAAAAMYLFLSKQGICSETPFMQNATQYCVVDRSLSQ